MLMPFTRWLWPNLTKWHTLFLNTDALSTIIDIAKVTNFCMFPTEKLYENHERPWKVTNFCTFLGLYEERKHTKIGYLSKKCLVTLFSKVTNFCIFLSIPLKKEMYTNWLLSKNWWLLKGNQFLYVSCIYRLLEIYKNWLFLWKVTSFCTMLADTKQAHRVAHCSKWGSKEELNQSVCKNP